jgi:hypothetical protein
MSSGSTSGYGDSNWRSSSLRELPLTAPPERTTTHADDRYSTPEDTATHATEDTEDERAPRTRPRRKTSSASEFTGAPSPIQFRLPTDLITSMKLLSLQENVTLSELALRLLTTSEVCPRVWVSRRNAS